MNFFRRKASGLPCPAGPIPPGRTRENKIARNLATAQSACPLMDCCRLPPWGRRCVSNARPAAYKAAALPTELRRRETKIKRTCLLQPSGASDLGGREGGRQQLPAVGKECMHKETTMRFRGPVTGSRMLARRASVEPTARGFGDRRSALSYRRIQKEPRVSPSVALRVQYTSPAIGTSRNSFGIFG